MIEMVSEGLATLEVSLTNIHSICVSFLLTLVLIVYWPVLMRLLQVSLKHSGSLFMYAGHKGGAYAKNSFGNM